jgi:hypothetical protein
VKPVAVLENTQPDTGLAIRAAKLWPHREHESNALMSLFCRVGLHHWLRLSLASLIPDKDILHCFWCSKVKIDGVIYDT